MKTRITEAAVVALLLLVLYALINIVHLIWMCVNPEGYWSFQVFRDVLVGALLAIACAVFAAFALFLIVKNTAAYLIALARGASVRVNPLKEGGTILLAIAISVLSFLWEFGAEFKFNAEMADSYSYISQSEGLIASGRFVEAMADAESAYTQANEDTIPPSSFFFLSSLYYRSPQAQEQRLSTLYATTVNYAFCSENTNKPARDAEALYTAALRIAEAPTLGQDAQYKILPLASLVRVSLAQGKYADAENYFRKLLPFAQMAEGQDAASAITAFSLFARRAYETGQIEKAARLLTAALKLYENSELSQTSSAYITLLLNASMAELYLGRVTKSGQYLVQAQELVAKKQAKQVYLDFLHVKSQYCIKAAQQGSGDESVLDPPLMQQVMDLMRPRQPLKQAFSAEANRCLEELVAENEDRNGATSLQYAESLTTLAQFNARQHKFQQAQALNRQALQIIGLVKQDHQDLYYANLLQSIAIDYYVDKNQGVIVPIRDIENYYFKGLAEKFIFYTEEERERYVLKINANTNLLNAIRINMNRDGLSEDIYNSVLATKSIALYSNQHIREFIAGSHNPALQDYFRILQDKATARSREGSNDQAQSVVTESQLKIREKNVLQALVARPGFTPFNPSSVRWTTIRDALQEQETAVEIFTAPTHPYTDSLSYYALILRRDYTRPKLVRLFEQQQLTKLLNLPGNTEARINGIYSTHKEALLKLVWEPIAREAANSRRVYLSVSGTLHTVSLPALLSELYPEVVLLSSTRQLAFAKQQAPPQMAAAIFGDIDYDYPKPKADDPAGDTRTAVSFLSQSRRFPKLPYTANEITSIKRIIEGHSGGSAVLFKDSLASELAFRRVAGGNYNMLHVATHGFYLPSERIPVGNGLSVDGAGGYEESPLSRSGLMLAGANTLVNAASDRDGIITAEEIAQLDMSQVDLVVLSACETGLGSIEGSEGIFGLQRALKMAGVKSILVSLWKVPDKQTAELMTAFYGYYQRGLSKSRALAQAQGDLKKKYKLPFYWAGFQLINK